MLKLYQWTRLLSFKAFLIAFIVTLVGMSLLGRWCSQQNLYQNFVRFHPLIAPDSLYYPTVSQLRAIAKEQLQDRDKIGVIVGGSSVFNGVGQPPNQIWTKHLQETLGDRYRVMNFAFRGGKEQGGGAIAAQSLLDEGYKIIYTSDMVFGEFNPDATEVYSYFLWDALYKGLIKNHLPLQKYIQSTQASNPNFIELKLRMWLDSIFYFNDLWTAVGYKYFFTVWNMLVDNSSPIANFTKPRSQTLDPEIVREIKPPPERYRNLEELIPGLTEQEHRNIVGYCERLYEWQQNKWVVKNTMLDYMEQQAQLTFPEQFRSHTLLVMFYRSPYYYQTMETRYRDCWMQGTDLSIKQFQKIGYHAMEVQKELSSEDYFDSVHLAPSGGVKVAEEIAPQIKEIAAKNGYLP